jgi:hypothetical protein
MKKLLLSSSNIIKSFEKNPTNGGTPAIEKRSIVKFKIANELKLNSFSE